MEVPSITPFKHYVPLVLSQKTLFGLISGRDNLDEVVSILYMGGDSGW